MKTISIPIEITPEMETVFMYYQQTQATDQVVNPQTLEEFAIARAQEGVMNLFNSDVPQNFSISNQNKQKHERKQRFE